VRSVVARCYPSRPLCSLCSCIFMVHHKSLTRENKVNDTRASHSNYHNTISSGTLHDIPDINGTQRISLYRGERIMRDMQSCVATVYSEFSEVTRNNVTDESSNQRLSRRSRRLHAPPIAVKSRLLLKVIAYAF